mgnify:CR=1 FL=1
MRTDGVCLEFDITASAYAEAVFCLPDCDRQLHAARDILIIEIVTNKYLPVGTFAEKTRLRKRKARGQVSIKGVNIRKICNFLTPKNY